MQVAQKIDESVNTEVSLDRRALPPNASLLDTEKSAREAANADIKNTKLALDSLNPNQVSELHILQGKLKVIESLTTLQRDLDIIKENATQLALLRVRQDEIKRNIPSKDSRAENFASVTDPKILENIASDLNYTIDFRTRNMERRTNELKQDSPFDPGPKWSKHQMITDAYSKMDFVSIFSAFSESGNYQKLFSSVNSLKKDPPEDLVKSITDLNTSIISLNALPNVSSLEDTNREMRAAIVGGNYREAHLAFNNGILKSLGDSFTQADTSQNTKMMADYLAMVPQENLETMGYFFPNSPAIFKSEYLSHLRKNSTSNNQSDAATGIDSDFKQSLELHKRRLWDTEIPWQVPAALESDIRLLTTTYATMKRMSVLTSSLQTALEEIDLTVPEAERRNKREILIDSYWNLYHDTSNHVADEAKKAIQSLSKTTGSEISEREIIAALSSDGLSDAAKKILVSAVLDTSISVSENTFSIIHTNQNSLQDITRQAKTMTKGTEASFQLEAVLEPYARIIDRLQQIPTGAHRSLYQSEQTENGSMSNDPLTSSYDTFIRSTQNINTIVNSLEKILVEAGASTSSMQSILQTFTNVNRNHPEHAALKEWAKSFPARFAVLGVPWSSIQ